MRWHPLGLFLLSVPPKLVAKKKESHQYPTHVAGPYRLSISSVADLVIALCIHLVDPILIDSTITGTVSSFYLRFA